MADKIMVVDDEESLRKSVRLVLEAEGYEVNEAVNADDCWNKIQDNPPDLILLDIRMPGLSAEDLVRKIKDSPVLKSIKIIYVTAVVGSKELNKNREGVVGVIEKPFSNKELLKIIKEALSMVLI